MSGTPLTKPLHNGSVQVGTGVSCMGCKRGSTGLTALRSLPWPPELALGVGFFPAVRNNMPGLLSQQSGPIAQRLQRRHQCGAHMRRMDGVSRFLLGHARFVLRQLPAPQADVQLELLSAKHTMCFEPSFPQELGSARETWEMLNYGSALAERTNRYVSV